MCEKTVWGYGETDAFLGPLLDVIHVDFTVMISPTLLRDERDGIEETKYDN